MKLIQYNGYLVWAPWTLRSRALPRNISSCSVEYSPVRFQLFIGLITHVFRQQSVFKLKDLIFI